MKRVLMWVSAALIILPIAATVVVATSKNFAVGPWGAGFTTEWLAEAGDTLAPVILRSLGVAFLVVVINSILALILGLWIARTRSPITSIASALLSLPLAIPGIAISVALVTTYPQLRPSGFLLLAAHVVFTLPFALAALVPVLGSRELRAAEEVAGTLGADPARILATVTIPGAGVALAQASAMVFALSFGEFNVSFFVNPPGTGMIPFALFDSYATKRLEIASAQTTLFIATIAAILLILVMSRHLIRRDTQ